MKMNLVEGLSREIATGVADAKRKPRRHGVNPWLVMMGFYIATCARALRIRARGNGIAAMRESCA